MELLTNELIKELLSVEEATCISLYMPTHRTHPENQQDPIRYKNLVKQLEESLLLKYSSGETRKYLEPFEALSDDEEVWKHTLTGLAIFSSSNLFKVVGLHQSLDEMAMVADSFHTKPLRQYMQSTDRYHVLGLSLSDVRFFEGNRHELIEVELSAEVPRTISDALGEKLSPPEFGGTSVETSRIQHGHGGRRGIEDIESENFFRMVANTIYERYSKHTEWPLILAALPEHHYLFQKVNKNPMLLSKGIALNPTSISTDQLVILAWEIMEPEYLMEISNITNHYEQAKANGKGSDDMKEVALAAVEGRIDTLLVEADRMIAVRITNLVTGNTQNKDLTNPRVDDLLDDMGELVMKMGGQVMVLSADKMPSETGLAAIYRY